MTVLLAAPLWAAEVAFIAKKSDGKLVELEPGGHFLHVAIRVGDQWLHAHTWRGVELVDSIRDFGDEFVYMANPSVPEPGAEQVRAVLGKPFDMDFRWYEHGKTYCTRLIAELLDVKPRPMKFTGLYWRTIGVKPGHREPGLSPDELFDELARRDFTPGGRCEDFLQ
ncbi:MAG TPA: hypothetical protein PKC28_09505 [Bdellovibrionales bacterium]|nr:hypothetical protein [Bdellovibrionales bacterium]